MVIGWIERYTLADSGVLVRMIKSLYCRYILLYAYQISPEWSDQNKVVEESRPNARLVFNHHLMMILYAYQSKGNTNGLVMNM